ncbi:MAG: excinuclease ABC subunit UvrC [Pseudomonadota bacterium]
MPFEPKAFLKNLTPMPGVYRMYDDAGKILYVGKARNLKKRVTSYFRVGGLSEKTQHLVAQIAAVEITVTHTETEALILENNLIKEFQPPYNILLRDDKSYPYIFLSSLDTFPRLSLVRGARREQGTYFGPYPSASSVRESLNLLQKLFPVRQCEESFFRNRSRPCLQYQIKRCTAPCVGLVTPERYAEDVRHAAMFLQGKNHQVIDELVVHMEHAAAHHNYETAAYYRDQIAALRRVQEKQYVSGDTHDVDVIAAVARKGVSCVTVFYIRGGRNLGNKTFFPKTPGDTELADVLSAFITQYYLGQGELHALPVEVLVNIAPADAEFLEHGLAGQAGRKVHIAARVRGDRARWVKMAVANAEIALTSHLAHKLHMQARFEALQEALGLDQTPLRLECFDISHTQGEATVGACVVFDTQGPVKADYRRFNITDITPGDDYAAMHQVLTRRYRRLQEGEGKWPDMVLIDGGKGQLTQAIAVMEELQISGLTLLGVAKGPERRAGEEELFLPGRATPIILPPSSPALHLIQQIRDEAHRFAIAGHRARRGKARVTSPLEAIPGLGPKRRQQLLRQFGGLQGISRAGIDDLIKIKGINRPLAQKIYDTFHNE